MRISQLQSLTQEELELLLFIVNDIETLSPIIKMGRIGPKDLLWFKHDMLLQKVARQESKLNAEGKIIFQGLMAKLNKTTEQEIDEYASSSKSESTQSEFQF